MSQQVNALPRCPYEKWCGGCSMQRLPYSEQLKMKEKQVADLLKNYGRPEPILGMNFPYYYRNKAHAVFGGSLGGKIVCGSYERGSHRIVNIDQCQIEDRACDQVIASVRELLPSFRVEPYNEDTGRGCLRHIIVRRTVDQGQIMVILVTAQPTFPSRRNFVSALKKAHPNITTILQNINGQSTSVLLGERYEVLCGPGYLEDRLMGARFRISPGAFYQVNSQQTRKLYRLAIEMADLKGKERVLDAYCGTGTIGIAAAVDLARRSQEQRKKAEGGAGRQGRWYREQEEDQMELIGVECNPAAVRDARINARVNGLKRARFVVADAGAFMLAEAEAGRNFDLVFMDPPRAGSTEEFLLALRRLAPEKIVYISCDPKTQARDLRYLDSDYVIRRIAPVDMFPFTDGIENVVLLERAHL